MKFTLPQLSYSYLALAPYMDALTLEIHYSRHHQAYVDNLNKAIIDLGIGENKSLKELLTGVSQYPAVIRNNAGGHYNHSLFWEILSKNGKKKPDGALALAIDQTFGSLEAFKSTLKNLALGQFGSGWAWLSVNHNGQLFASSTANQDNPLMDVVAEKGTPILGIDVWEHAYYLNYQNKRADYIDAFFELLDWEAVSLKYQELVS